MSKLPAVQPFTEDERAAIEAESYFASLHALEFAERHSSETRTNIAARAGMAKSSVSKILNGSAKNIGTYTLFVLMRAMGFKLIFEPLDLKQAYQRASNFSFMPPKASADAGTSQHYVSTGESVSSSNFVVP